MVSARTRLRLLVGLIICLTFAGESTTFRGSNIWRRINYLNYNNYKFGHEVNRACACVAVFPELGRSERRHSTQKLRYVVVAHTPSAGRKRERGRSDSKE